MTPDEAPEQRWRRTVDRRNRPAKLKVDRLLRDFGYAELDPAVGDAIEARLAGVSLAVAPSLRNAAVGEVVTIYANDSAAPEEARAAPGPAVVDPAPAEEPAVSDVAQMVTYLKQQVLDARAEAERLRTELDGRIAARLVAERESESERIIAEQAAALEAQSRQLAELGAALNSTREALADTRDEIRRAVGELQALPQPVAPAPEPPPLRDDEPVFYAVDDEDAPDSLSGEEWADGREEAEAAALAPAAAPDELADVGGEVDESALGEHAGDPEAPAEGGEPSPDLDEPVPEAPGLELDLDAPLPPANEWLPAALRPPDDDGMPATGEPLAAGTGEPEDGDAGPSDFDDFLYAADALYDPAEPRAGRSDTSLESEIEAHWPDEPSAALPPPPPSLFADEPAADPPAPAERPMLGKVLRGRGGRSRGRWEGTCSICGRLPQVSRRKDLEAAGWDLDDDAAACPQCRGVG